MTLTFANYTKCDHLIVKNTSHTKWMMLRKIVQLKQFFQLIFNFFQCCEIKMTSKVREKSAFHSVKLASATLSHRSNRMPNKETETA